MAGFLVQTARVGLRKFRPNDLDSFFEMNSDPEVMEFFPALLTRDECRAFMTRINQKIDEQGFGFWAAESLESGQLMGFVGITRVSYTTEFTPAVEIGWRMSSEFWGKGLATEAAKACLGFGFDQAGLDQIVSFTSIHNGPSRRVMERIGMKKVGEFDHPKLQPGNRLERHVLFRIKKSEFSVTGSPRK